ncbi:hypothetical protein [Flavobacterium sp. AG291]|uniref:hypothetical protein n=1 Tax=Flavobacterium sp. AG291 TaxID=2184000 RepID=UPI000E2C4303|nr:hypothetical protein [Flavobacterium sp. AG291]RDI13403.1 hypothetical protein DEU42_103317 [Flavobacterium sp. AG291]
MKRILFIMFLITLVSCKKDHKQQESVTAEEHSNKNEMLKDEVLKYDSKRLSKFLQCVSNDQIYNTYIGLPLRERARWIDQNGIKICENQAYTCIYEIHEVLDVDEFNRWVRTHPENNEEIKYYEKDWDVIKKFTSDISCYEYYVGFTFNGNTINLKKLKYSYDETCYSKPFFESLSKFLKSGDQLYFTKAMTPVIKPSGQVTTEERVVFEIRNGTQIRRFDISHDPTFL